MAVIPILKLKDGKRSLDAVFPDDYDIIDHSQIDDSETVVDAVLTHRWFLLKNHSARTPYAMSFCNRDGRTKTVLMHRLVWEVARGPIPERMTIDHANRYGLDNRLENLRIASRSQQNYNLLKQRKHGFSSSEFKGVSKRRDNPNRIRVYKARIALPGRVEIPLGNYEYELESAFAYNVAALIIQGSFACLNEISLDSISPDRQQEIRSMVERKLRDRGLIPSET